MKSYVNTLFIILVLFSFEFINAQGFRVGVKGGVNFAKHIEELEHPEFRYRTGVIGGIFVSYKFSELIAVQSEVLYSMKGNVRVFPEQIIAQTTISESEVVTKLNYIEIPILMFISFDINSNIIPKLLFGPAISILLTASSETTINGSSMEIDQKELFSATEFGVLLGIGTDYKFDNNSIGLDLRYNLGLTDLNEGVGGGKITSNTISLLLAYSVGF